MKLRILLITAVVFCGAAFSEIGNGTGLQISAAGDLMGRLTGTANNRVEPREAEVLLFAPIDQLFDGVLNLAAHNENGKVFFEIHELTIGSSKLIPRSRFRVGQYFLAIGRLNQFHRHDWPFISAPKVQEQFLHAEGINDSGVEYGYLLPTSFYLDLTVGITNGWIYGHAHDQGTKPLTPVHYARLATYHSLFGGGGMQTGLNYLGRTDATGLQVSLIGLDLTAKWREATFLKMLFQSEFWYRIKSGSQTENTLGFYLYPQYGINQSWSVGLRLDGYSVLSTPSLAGGGLSFDYGIVPTVSYKASEFSTIRAAYNIKGYVSQGVESKAERLLELQAVFILGSHPAHDF